MTHPSHPSARSRRPLTAVSLACAAALAAPANADPAAYAPEPSVHQVVADPSGYGGQLSLPVGGSRILRFDQPIGRVLLGEPKVADVIVLSDRTLYVLGKGAGATSLTVLGRGAGGAVRPLATLDLRIGYDVDNIKRAMADVMPGEPVNVTARGDGVILTGMLSSSAAAARAQSLAERYAPDHVVNLTGVRGAEQVMLSVRVSEVQRSALQQLGLSNITALWDTTRFNPVGAPEMFGLLPPVLNPDAVGNLLGHDRSGDWTMDTLFDALEKRGYGSTLAEPNLVALSGETAIFFAGGEFPVPVPQIGLNNTVTIEYKQYGVSIGFTPTVYGDTINLVVAPEVSQLDQANGVVLQGFKIPALTTRRARTTVDLRNGQSFAIAGLIRREFTDNMRGLPGASNVPVLGALFRSTGYQNNETEVVIIVTVHLVKPSDGRNLVVPTDTAKAPTMPELYLGGVMNKSAARPAGLAAAGEPAAKAVAATPPVPMAAPAPPVVAQASSAAKMAEAAPRQIAPPAAPPVGPVVAPITPVALAPVAAPAPPVAAKPPIAVAAVSLPPATLPKPGSTWAATAFPRPTAPVASATQAAKPVTPAAMPGTTLPVVKVAPATLTAVSLARAVIPAPGATWAGAATVRPNPPATKPATAPVAPRPDPAKPQLNVAAIPTTTSR